ncbi:hypothetical protein V2J09_000859 [Rumex salicifolius]
MGLGEQPSNKWELDFDGGFEVSLTLTCSQQTDRAQLSAQPKLITPTALHLIMGLRRAAFAAVLVSLLFLAEEAAAAGQPPFACGASNRNYGFCRRRLPIRERARDLVSRLTLEEKVSQLVNDAAGIPRLGVPAYQWWSEALHGVADAGPGVSLAGQKIPAATSFPQVILTAASFDSHLWFRIARAIGTEARGVYNAGQAKGMTFWAPNINVFRDPRWGRGQETPGEDPLVSATYSVSYVRGVQGDLFNGGKPIAGDSQLLASACCKHFTAYDLDRWHNITRYVFDARVSLSRLLGKIAWILFPDTYVCFDIGHWIGCCCTLLLSAALFYTLFIMDACGAVQVTAQDLADTYQPPFEKCVKEGRASGIMCAYNRVNGVPSCADYDLLTTTARGKWGFQGYITSDCDAVSIIHEAQGYAKTPEDAVVDVLNAGMDVNCGSYLYNYTKSAIHQKKLAVKQIDRALQNLFTVRMRLGLFDGNPITLPHGKITSKDVCSKEHQDLALEAALHGIVLLKNSANLLPLPKRNTKPILLAVIGPNADVAKTLLGNYHGPPCNSVTPLQAIRGYVRDIEYLPGCESVACSSPSINDAVEVAQTADYVVMFVGLDLTQEREDHDREDLVLPGKQQSLVQAVARAAKKPVVLVVLSGGPVDISFAKAGSKVGSIVWGGYPGEAGGVALAQVLFGDHNPGGKLPVTWYPKGFIKVPMTDMRMRADVSSGYPGRTYRFYRGDKVFEFGHGLSYTTYSYHFISVSKRQLSFKSLGDSVKFITTADHSYAVASEMGDELCEKLKFSATIGVKNEGDMAGKHPVLVYVRQEEERAAESGSPLKQLVGFQSVSLEAGETSQLEFGFSPCEHLSKANQEGLMVIQQGTHFLMVGDQQYPITIA